MMNSAEAGEAHQVRRLRGAARGQRGVSGRYPNNDGVFIRNDGFCINNDGVCVKNDVFRKEHCGEVEHDDDFCYTCTEEEVIIEVSTQAISNGFENTWLFTFS